MAAPIRKSPNTSLISPAIPTTPVVPSDPFAGIKPDSTSDSPGPQQVNDFHLKSDKDSSITAQHHSLGARRNQASPGDHIHDGKNCRKLGEGQNLTLTGSKGGNVALANLITMLQNWISFTDSTT